MADENHSSSTNGEAPEADRTEDFSAVLHRAAVLLCGVADRRGIARSMLEIVRQRFPESAPHPRGVETQIVEAIADAAHRLIVSDPWTQSAWTELAIVSLRQLDVPDAEDFMLWACPPVAEDLAERLRVWAAPRLRVLRELRAEAVLDGEPTEALDREIGAIVDELIKRQRAGNT